MTLTRPAVLTAPAAGPALEQVTPQPPGIRQRREVIAMVPAHNEEAGIAATLEALGAQSSPPDRVLVICDNCTDRTAEIAVACGAEVFATVANTRKKAGGLNQALFGLMPSLRATDIVLVVDADTKLGPKFVESAIRDIEAGAGACGGVFYGDEGGGLLGVFQRAEYCRYSRQLDRNQGKARVLTGTASAFTVEAFRALDQARRSGRLPGAQTGPAVASVYTTASLTEDGEITLALKSLGFKCVSPGDCTVTTEIMTTIPDWWKQRTRWQRGALEDLRVYGMTPVTRSYILRQGAMGVSVAMFGLYVLYAVATTVMYGFHTNYIWLGISGLFVFHQVWTVRRAGWREIATATLVVPELLYDALQHLVWLWCVAGWLRRSRTSW